MSRGNLTSGDYLFVEKLSQSRGVIFPCLSPADEQSATELRAGTWFGKVAEQNPKNDYNSEYKAQFDDSAKKESMLQQIASVKPVYSLKRFK